MTRRIFYLDQFGLSLSALRALGKTQVTISVQQRGPDIGVLRPHAPARRARMMREHLHLGLSRIRDAWRGGEVTLRGDVRLPWTIDGRTTARNAWAIAGLEGVDFIFLHAVDGFRRKRQKPKLGLYTVWGLVAVEVEGQTSGYQEVEDRLVLVRASSEEDACARLEQNWEAYAAPGMNRDGEFFRWKLEKIVDVYELMDHEINLNGTEVYSRLRRRRVRPGDAWSPQRSDD